MTAKSSKSTESNGESNAEKSRFTGICRKICKKLPDIIQTLAALIEILTPISILDYLPGLLFVMIFAQ